MLLYCQYLYHILQEFGKAGKEGVLVKGANYLDIITEKLIDKAIIIYQKRREYIKQVKHKKKIKFREDEINEKRFTWRPHENLL